MKITFVRKTNSSSMGNCPALYQADNGHHVIQGWRLADSDREMVSDLVNGEAAVEVPPDVVTDVLPPTHPALRPTARGTYLVCGRLLDDETAAQLRDLADNETAVEIAPVQERP